MTFIERLAKACHEINRAYCQALGDYSHLSWDNTVPRIQRSTILGVEFYIKNPNVGPEGSHQEWMAHKVAEGWTYGPEKDLTKLTHPSLVPFEELPVEQQAKDYIFQSVIRQTLDTVFVPMGEEQDAV